MREIPDRILIDPTMCLPLSQSPKPVVFGTLVGQTSVEAIHVNVSFRAGPFVLTCTPCSLEGEASSLAQRTKNSFWKGKQFYAIALMLVNCYQLYLSEKKVNLEEVRGLGQDEIGRGVIESECKPQSAEIAVSSRLSHDFYSSLIFISLQCLLLSTVASYSNVGFFVEPRACFNK